MSRRWHSLCPLITNSYMKIKNTVPLAAHRLPQIQAGWTFCPQNQLFFSKKYLFFREVNRNFSPKNVPGQDRNGPKPHRGLFCPFPPHLPLDTFYKIDLQKGLLRDPHAEFLNPKLFHHGAGQTETDRSRTDSAAAYQPLTGSSPVSTFLHGLIIPQMGVCNRLRPPCRCVQSCTLAMNRAAPKARTVKRIG